MVQLNLCSNRAEDTKPEGLIQWRLIREDSMKTPAVFPIALALAATVLSSPAVADDENVLSTPPMHPGNTLECIAANVGKTPVNLLIQLFDENGNVPFSENCQLPPGAINFGGQQCGLLGGAPNAGWCKFTLTFGRKESVRATICSLDINLGIGAAPSCLPAQ
jgi:hypothetical protein